MSQRYFTFLLLFCFMGIAGLVQAQSTHKRLASPLNMDAPATEVQAWLEARYAAQWGAGSALLLESDIPSPGGRHLTFTQTFEGWPLFDRGVKANFFSHGSVSLMESIQPLPYPPMGVFQVNENDIPARFMEEMGPGTYEVKAGFRVMEGLPSPVYRVDCHPDYQSIHYRVWLDGATGRETEREVLNLFRQPMTDTSGRAMIFLPDPCTKAQVSYGDLFVDNDDADDAIFHQLVDTLRLRDLTLDNGVYRLTGLYVDIQDLAPRAVPVATSTDGDFFFTRDSAWFEDAMVYYHIDTFQRYVQSLGFLNLRNSNDPLQADPHGMNLSDNSSFVPGVRHLLFGEGGVDDAEDADVIVHEYGHALSDAASPATNSGRERRGIDEGIGDYIAASYSFDSREFGWFNLFNWDGHNEYWAGRVAVSSEQYPPSNTSMYTYGEIWSSTLMQLRISLGASVMDRLFFEEMYSNYVNMTLPDAALLMIDADSALFGGVHTQSLQSAFCQRQIFVGANCNLVANDPLQPNDSYTWSLDHDKGMLLITGPPAQHARMEIIAMDGRQLWTQTGVVPHEIFIPTNWPSGIYLLRLQVEGEAAVSLKWRLP